MSNAVSEPIRQNHHAKATATNEVQKIHIKTPTKHLDDESFRNEELWESEHVIDATSRTHRILDTNLPCAKQALFRFVQ